MIAHAKTSGSRDASFNRGSNFDMHLIKSRAGAIILIVLGAIFLLSNLGLLPRLGPLLAQWWPLILIVVGVSMLVRR
jgi:Domain of unknown function (DUF5668)